MRLLLKKGFSMELLETKQIRELIAEYTQIFDLAIQPSIESGVISRITAERLREDIFLFSGFKTYQELKEASLLLQDEKGQIKPFYRFYKDIATLKEDYNKHWLNAEYLFAQASAEMASKWYDFDKDADLFNLQYRTAADGKVRPEHQVLHRVTLSFDDPFWDEFFPPNGWRCRCTVVQVRKEKYPASNSTTAIQAGREATYHPNKQGINKLDIFRFNPGKQQVIFPPHHPYYEVSIQEKDRIRGALHPEDKLYTIIPTENGRIRIHTDHGKNEREENIRIASYFANKYGYEIDLLPRDDNKPCADTFNRTLGYEEEYKLNLRPTTNAIDRAIRSAKRQADHIVLWIESGINLEELTTVIRNRVKREENIQSITMVVNGKDKTYSRSEILEGLFKIQLADMK